MQRKYLFSRYSNMVIMKLLRDYQSLSLETAYIMAWNDPLSFWAMGTVHTVYTAFVHGIIDRILM